jgi:NADH-quinone oxidoreductase subunit D
MGAYGLDLGTFSPFLYAFREREMILDLFEEVCGARLTYSYITVGGAHDDLPDGWVERCTKFLDYFEPRILEYHALTTTNHIFVKRTAGIGVLSKALALSHGCSGPMLRGSLNRKAGDPEWDLRRLEPYCGYEGYDFQVVLPPFDDDYYGVPYRAPRGAVIGDCWHRFYVRMLEVVQSVRLVRQGLTKYAALHAEGENLRREFEAKKDQMSAEERKKGEQKLQEAARAKYSHRVEVPRHLPAGEAYLETECPRGQMGFYVVGRATKDPVPFRVRARSSSFSNLSVTDEICRGCLIADVPAIVGSIDIVMGEIDR